MHYIQMFSLPIPLATPIFTLLLPIFTGLGLWSFSSSFANSPLRGSSTIPLLQSNSNGLRRTTRTSLFRSLRTNLPTQVIFLLFLILLDAVLATLSLNRLLPSSDENSPAGAAVTCALERHWANLYSAKDSSVIRRIQDRHQCCGFNSPLDRAWPFPSAHPPTTARACLETLGWDRRCREGWRRDERVADGMIVVVVGACAVLQVRW